ncbi:MAG TPA: PLP-dependent aminotransferase family protein [Chloroflexota bacterium]|nr:PLP-dependent aminotransferase family protein [Chloroflexota bacterium]
MRQGTAEAALPAVVLDHAPGATRPLYRQLYDQLREAILSGQLAAGTRLPATRTLQATLGVARTTVVNAFAQLLAEGYLEAKVGSGTYVASTLPDHLLHAGRQGSPSHPPAVRRHLTHARRAGQEPVPAGDGIGAGGRAASAPGRGLSQRGTLLAGTPVFPRSSVPLPVGRPERLAFRPGLPAMDAFPWGTWATLAARRWRRPPAELVGYGEAAGYRPLREAVAAYLGAARAVRCDPQQVIVVAGSQQGLDLAARVLLDVGDPVWIEDPGYLGARGALLAAGAQLVPVPVDEQGLDVEAGRARCPQARLAYVTPSHQYPLGMTMTLARRLALLEWARQSGAWVLEDDYDSEYRYTGRPLAALQGLDRHGRVIYLGTFSKVLFPALRLGYVVAPPDLVAAFVAARALADRHSPSVDQAVLADFIAEGHFVRHLRRMRLLYAERQRALLEAAGHTVQGLLEVAPAPAGMHLVGRLPPGVSDSAAARRAAGRGLVTPPLSAYALGPPRQSGLILGYAAVPAPEHLPAMRRLGAALRPLVAGTPTHVPVPAPRTSHAARG